jgi:hypothetical protein
LCFFSNSIKKFLVNYFSLSGLSEANRQASGKMLNM